MVSRGLICLLFKICICTTRVFSCDISNRQLILIPAFFVSSHNVLKQCFATSDCEECQHRFIPCAGKTAPAVKLTRHNWWINVTWHTIKPLYTTKCCFDMKTTRPSSSAHLIKPQTLRGLINVPANFHKWRINYNWFQSLIHLLKWHPFIHVLTCFAISSCLRWLREWAHCLILYSKSFLQILVTLK